MNENGTTPESSVGIEVIAEQIAADVRRMRELLEMVLGRHREDPRGPNDLYRDRS